MNKFKSFFALAGGAVVAYFEKYALLYAFVAAAVLLDLVTGMLAAVIAGDGLSSRIARRGVFKKIVLLVAVAFGTFLDVLMPFAAAKVGLRFEGALLFSSIIGVYICVTESISVAENICRCRPDILPAQVTGLLKEFQKKLEQNKEDTHGKL